MKGVVFMTDLEKIKAAKAAYARDWRKRNPERAKQIQQRYWERKAEGREKDAAVSDNKDTISKNS